MARNRGNPPNKAGKHSSSCKGGPTDKARRRAEDHNLPEVTSTRGDPSPICKATHPFVVFELHGGQRKWLFTDAETDAQEFISESSTDGAAFRQWVRERLTSVHTERGGAPEHRPQGIGTSTASSEQLEAPTNKEGIELRRDESTTGNKHDIATDDLATPVKRRRAHHTVQRSSEACTEESEVDKNAVWAGEQQRSAKDEDEEYSDIEFAMAEVKVTDLQGVYEDIFKKLQQKGLKQIIKAWLRRCHPQKQASFPYNGGKEAKSYPDFEALNSGKETAPDYWPNQSGWADGNGCRHREPDHIFKKERLILAKHLLCADKKYKNAVFAITDLQDCTMKVIRDCAKDFHPDAEWLLSALYDARRKELQYQNGEINGDTVLSVPIPPEKISRKRRVAKSKKVGVSTGENTAKTLESPESVRVQPQSARVSKPEAVACPPEGSSPRRRSPTGPSEAVSQKPVTGTAQQNPKGKPASSPVADTEPSPKSGARKAPRPQKESVQASRSQKPTSAPPKASEGRRRKKSGQSEDKNTSQSCSQETAASERSGQSVSATIQASCGTDNDSPSQENAADESLRVLPMLSDSSSSQCVKPADTYIASTTSNQMTLSSLTSSLSSQLLDQPASVTAGITSLGESAFAQQSPLIPHDLWQSGLRLGMPSELSSASALGLHWRFTAPSLISSHQGLSDRHKLSIVEDNNAKGELSQMNVQDDATQGQTLQQEQDTNQFRLWADDYQAMSDQRRLSTQQINMFGVDAPQNSTTEQQVLSFPAPTCPNLTGDSQQPIASATTSFSADDGGMDLDMVPYPFLHQASRFYPGFGRDDYYP